VAKLRSSLPVFVKRIVWNWKHRESSTEAALCPHELLDSLSNLEVKAAVLDLGCGPGNLLAALRVRGWNGHFIGVDVSEKTIEIAKKSGDANAEWRVSAIENFPIPSQKVSTVCLCESIYYVNLGDVSGPLKRCRECLEPGGRIVIRICHAAEHREYIELLSSLGAQANPPIYVLN
jgi:SAM-dependent methyltransferase